MKLQKTITIILLIATAGSVDCFAGGVGTGGAEFMEILPGTRSAGMGGSGMAMSLEADSIYLNPAALYLARSKKQFYFSHINWWQSVGYEYLAYMHGFKNIGVFAASFTWLHMPELELTNIYGTPTGDTMNVYDIMINLSYAGRIVKGLYWGVNLKSMRRGLGSYGRNVFATDLGCVYRIRISRGSGTSRNLSELSFAAAVQNALSTGIYFIDSNFEDELPLIVKLGAAYKPGRKLSFAFDVDIVSDNQVKVHAGAEYWFVREFALRMGYERTDDLGALSGLCFGFSFRPDVKVEFMPEKMRRKSKYFIMQLDYALRLAGDMGIVHRVALRMYFKSDGKRRRKK